MIIVTANQPPAFASPLVPQNVIVGYTTTYTLPEYSDPEAQPTILDSITLSSGEALPSFIVNSGNTLIISPTLNSQAGLYNLEITLSDGFNLVTSTFTITVSPNLPPAFAV